MRCATRHRGGHVVALAAVSGTLTPERIRAIAQVLDLWSGMIGPDGRESPGGNPLIVWNQPHPIHRSELLYRGAPGAATLARYRDLVFETAEGLASMLEWDDVRRRDNLGPPRWIAQEIHDPASAGYPEPLRFSFSPLPAVRRVSSTDRRVTGWYSGRASV